MASCIFCDSAFADPILPHNRQKICVLFDVSFNGKKLLHDGKICTRCHLQVEMIDNATRLKTEMNQCLQDKLGRNEDRHAVTNGMPTLVKPHPVIPPMPSEPSPRTPVTSMSNGHISPPAPPPMMSLPSVSTAEMMAMASIHSSLAALASAPMLALPQLTSAPEAPPINGPKDGVYMCVHCGQAFKNHPELMAHDMQCTANKSNGSAGGDQSPIGCDRCGQSLKYRSPEDRIKHIVQCKGQGLRRGRPSTGIVNCPKCGLSLKNRMNHDRINHVQRCNGSGLKRGRPSLKCVEKHQCDKCSRNLWSKEQLELHASKCDGSHVERRGRKPGDNSCMVCGENLIYRHILKKHLRQAHGINPQNLDDSVIAAVKNEHSVDELSTPYKRILLNQIQQQLTMPLPDDTTSPQPESEDSMSQSFDSALSHRKKAKPYKYVPTEDHLLACTRCNKKFEHHLFEQHVCNMSDIGDEESMNGAMSEMEDGSQDELIIDDEKPEETTAEDSVDDVISAISERAEYKQSLGTSGVKGSAIAQVISGLLGASKVGSNNSGNNSLPAAHRQSIST